MRGGTASVDRSITDRSSDVGDGHPSTDLRRSSIADTSFWAVSVRRSNTPPSIPSDTASYSTSPLLLLAACTMIFTFDQIDSFTLTVSPPPFILPSQFGLLAGPLFAVVYTCSGVAMSLIADRFNRVRVLALALALWSTSAFVVGFSTTFWHVALCRATQALCCAASTPFAASMIADAFPPQARGTAMGIFNVGIYLGYDTALAAAPAITTALDWRWPFWFFGGAGVALALAVAFVLKEPPRRTWRSDGRGGSGSDGGSECERGRGRGGSGGGSGAGDVDGSEGTDGVQGGMVGGERTSKGTRLLSAEASSSSSSHLSSSADTTTTVRRASPREIAKHWLTSPALILLCIAGGVRNAGGFGKVPRSYVAVLTRYYGCIAIHCTCE